MHYKIELMKKKREFPRSHAPLFMLKNGTVRKQMTPIPETHNFIFEK